MKYLETQKNLLFLALALVGAGALVFFFVLRPRIKRNNQLRVQAENKKVEMRKKLESRWALDPVYLRKLRKQYEEHRFEMLNELVEVLRNSNREFLPLIDPYNNGQTFQSWAAGIQLFDYQELYGKVTQRLARRQIYLDESRLGITERSAPPRGSSNLTYRLVIQIYLAERVALLCQKHGLDLRRGDWPPAGVENVNPNRPPAMLQVMPVRLYSTAEGTEPYLEEYPVKIRARGNIVNVCNFLHELTEEDHFLPLEMITVRSTGVEKFQQPGYQYKRHEDVEVELVCSGFLVTEDIDQLLKERASKKAKQSSGWSGGI